MKVCNICKKSKNETEFSIRRASTDGLSYKCKGCTKKYNKTYHTDNRERLLDKSKRWIKNNYERHRLNQREYIKQNPKRRILDGIRSNAKRRKIEFSLTIHDIYIPEKCPLLGIKIFRTGLKSCDNSPSVDRIDSKKGYVRGNIKVISNKANRIKSNATAEELKLIASNIDEYITSQDQ